MSCLIYKKLEFDKLITTLAIVHTGVNNILTMPRYKSFGKEKKPFSKTFDPILILYILRSSEF